MPEPSRSLHSSVGFLRAFLRALRDRETYDVRSNAGQWLGFVLALPIPIMALVLAAPLPVLLVSFAAPIAWGVIVGASRRVGILGEDVIRRMRLEALSDRRVRDETYASLSLQVDVERDERAKLERLQRMADAELALAQIVQESLVPVGVQRGDLVVTVRHLPCTYVGGDYLQAAMARPDLLYLCVGDVSGHGVAAALVVSRIHALVERMILQDARPGPCLEALDRTLLELLENTTLYMTFAVFRIDLAAREIEYATAGHPPQYLLRTGGRVEELFTPNRPIGLQLAIPRCEPVVSTATYEPGETLLLFSDGLYEVRGAASAQELWGEARLKSLFARLGSGDPSVTAERILAEVKGFSPQPFEDDVSLLVARLGALGGAPEG